ncbi:MAG TPA: arsenate reductase ArsC [Nitriliruptorales bacterium]
MTPTPDLDDDQHLERTIEALASEFAGSHTREAVAALVHDSAQRLPDAHDPAAVVLLTHRFARDRLRLAEKAAGGRGHAIPEVLFVCVRNAGRSQMAEALLRDLAGGRVHASSAGSAPGTAVHDNVAQVMREVGIDLAQAYPKPLTQEAVEAADVVVTMGCGDACPVVPATRYLDWELDDPHGAGLDATRATRDEIRRRVQAIIDDLTSGSAAAGADGPR